MLAKLNTFALLGIDAVAVEVEVDAAPGLPKTVLVSPILQNERFTLTISDITG
jgi:hypothetical protein